MIVEKTPKNAEKFTCIKCNFNCSKQSDYTRHLMTRKHKMIVKKRQKMSNYIRVNVEKNISMIADITDIKRYARMFMNPNTNPNLKSKKK